MRKYLIVEDFNGNAFLSSRAGRDPDTGKAYSLYIDGDHDGFQEDARKIFASLDK